MTISRAQYRLLGKTGLAVPPVVCGTASLANVRRVVTDQAKLAICGEWFKGIEPPVLIEVAYDVGEGLALQVLGRMLRRLEVASDEVVILLTLGGDSMAVAAQSASSDRLVDCWEKSCQFLGSEYRPKLIAVTDGDDSSWQAANQLKTAGQVRGIGLVVGGQHAAESRAALVGPDWITLDSGCTVMRHSRETLAFVAEMAERQIPIVVSGVFDGGFLVGGNRLDGLRATPGRFRRSLDSRVAQIVRGLVRRTRHYASARVHSVRTFAAGHCRSAARLVVPRPASGEYRRRWPNDTGELLGIDAQRGAVGRFSSFESLEHPALICAYD